MAKKLCIEKATDIGVNESNVQECITSVASYLTTNVNKWASNRLLEIPVTIDNNQFDVAFFPERESTEVVAKNLCTNHAEVLKLTAETFPICVTTVTNYLNNAVANWISEKTLKVPITIDENTFEVSFLPERQSSADMATKLCKQNVEALRLTDEDLLNRCFTLVENYLSFSVRKWIASKTLEFTLNVNNEPYTFNFMPERETSLNVAKTFCVQKANELQLTQENVVPNCIEPITQRIQAAIVQWVDSKRFTVPIKINNQQVNFSFIPERENPASASQRFCVSQATALGLTQENILSACIKPVNEIIVNALQAASAPQN